jgi:hypothetical protein
MKKTIRQVLLISSSILLATASATHAERPNGPNSLTSRMNRMNSCMSTFTSSHIGSSSCFTGSSTNPGLQQEQRNDDRVAGLQRIEFLPAPSSGNPTFIEQKQPPLPITNNRGR